MPGPTRARFFMLRASMMKL